MNALEVKQNLKNEIKSVYVVSGNDNFLINTALTYLKESLVDGFEEFNYIRLDGSDLKESDYKLALNTLPFGSGNRLIVINNINSVGAGLVNKFSELSFCNVVVVCVSPSYTIAGENINCDHLNSQELKKYLISYFNKAQLQVENNAIDYIIGISNSDLNYISNELVKVIGYLEKGEIVTTDIIKLLFTKNESYFVYNLTTAIDNKDNKLAMKILNSLQENVSISEIFMFMGSYFRKMFYTAINANNDEIATILKTKPYAITKARECVNKNGKSFYVNMYNKYTNLDYEIKTGKITPINAIYSLILL